MQEHTRSVSDLTWSPFDSFVLATCAPDGYIYLWDIRESHHPSKKFRSRTGNHLEHCCNVF
jgi:WD40 repeat protein